nr:hypothetical protein [Tanacetum cinerariifolium]
MILFGADNRPPILDKDLYDSWKSIIELYMQNREHKRIIIESVENGPLIWPTVKENGVTRTKKYAGLSVVVKIQADCDMKATNIILQEDDLIVFLNKEITFLTTIASLRFFSTNNQLRTSSNPRNQATIQDGRVTMQQVQGKQGQSYSRTGYKSNATSSGGNNESGHAMDKAMLAEAHEARQVLDEEQLAFLADPGVPDSQARFSWPTCPTMVLKLSQSKPSDASLIKIKAPKELPKLSLVNESLKKLKFHLTRFDNVMNIWTTPDAHTEDLLNEIMEVQTVFDQMDVVVQQSSVDKQCLEIAKKELLLENDRLLQQIMSQDVLLTVMNSMSLIGKYVNMERKRNESSDKCFNLDAKLLKSQNAHNNLLKRFLKSTKEHSDSLNDKLNLKSTKNEDLKDQIQDKVFMITSLKNDLQKVKGKEIIDIAAQIPTAHTIVLGMFKLDLETLALRLLQNKEVHIEYLKYTQEQADILQEIVEQAKPK